MSVTRTRRLAFEACGRLERFSLAPVPVGYQCGPIAVPVRYQCGGTYRYRAGSAASAAVALLCACVRCRASVGQLQCRGLWRRLSRSSAAPCRRRRPAASGYGRGPRPAPTRAACSATCSARPAPPHNSPISAQEFPGIPHGNTEYGILGPLIYGILGPLKYGILGPLEEWIWVGNIALTQIILVINHVKTTKWWQQSSSAAVECLRPNIREPTELKNIIKTLSTSAHFHWLKPKCFLEDWK